MEEVKDINGKVIKVGHIVEHRYIKFEEHRQRIIEEVVVITMNPQYMFTIATRSLKIIGKTLKMIEESK